MPPPTAVIFDCDGVLVDSETPVVAAEAALLRSYGVAISDVEATEMFVGLTVPGMKQALAEHGIAVPERFWTERVALIHDGGILESVQPIPGIEAVVDAVALPYCLASSSGHDRIDIMLRAAGLAGRFPRERRFSAEDVQRGKPFPDLPLHAAAETGHDPARCLVIEDSRPGVVAGVAAGMAVIGLTAGGHCPPGHDSRLRDAGAAEVVATTADLLTSLSRRGAAGPR